MVTVAHRHAIAGHVGAHVRGNLGHRDRRHREQELSGEE